MQEQNKNDWEKAVPVNNPWVAIDLDGTLMEDGYYPEFGPPRPSARAACDYFKAAGIKVMVFTARTAITGLDGQFQNVNKTVSDIYEWAEFNEIHIDYVWPMPKPTFVLAFFDDRAVHVGKGSNAWGLAIRKFEETFGNAFSIKDDWKKKLLPPAKEKR
jgi:hypothetical protein